MTKGSLRDVSHGTIELADLLADTRTIEVPYGSFVVSVSYRPSVMNMELQERVRTMTPEEQNSPETVTDLMMQLLTGWNLAQNGEPVPITREVLMSVGPLTGHIMQAVQQDMVPNS